MSTAIDSLANPHLNNDLGAIIAFPGETFGLDPFQPTLFVFCNRQRDKLKVLYWHNNGFCLLYKRLEKERFQWLRNQATTQLRSERELK